MNMRVINKKLELLPIHYLIINYKQKIVRYNYICQLLNLLTNLSNILAKLPILDADCFEHIIMYISKIYDVEAILILHKIIENEFSH